MKETWRRIRRPLLIVLLVCIGIVSYCLYAQQVGIFPGNLLNRPAVERYLRRQYHLEDLSVQYSAYDPVRGWYVYDCTGRDGAEPVAFTVAAKGYRVRQDGMYRLYRCDPQATAVVDAYMRDYFARSWTEADVRLDIETAIWVPRAQTGQAGQAAQADAQTGQTAQTAQAYMEQYGDTMEFTVTLYGPSISFDAYKAQVYKVLYLLQQELPLRPDFMQVFYRRTDGTAPAGDDEPGDAQDAEQGVLQYESHLSGFMFNYNEQGLTNAGNVHFYVEATAAQRRELRRYNLIRWVNFAVIGGTVVVLGTYWVVRHIRKTRKGIYKTRE